MEKMTVEQLEWLITLTEDQIRTMDESPEKDMLRKTVGQLREARLKAMEA